ncbi:MAG TPA: methionyl-tRNA formyltransferase [Gemmataceae bacterium]|nr:methionyl-tRNA formyltransferase [Gemmataceae bacterium]
MRIVMMGTGTFAEPTFEALLASGQSVVGLVTQPDRAVGDKRGSTRQVGKGMKPIAELARIPVFQPESINTPEGEKLLRDLAPDLLVVAAYGQILSREILGVPPRGGINVHASLLPKYRGAAPVAWAIKSGETESGISIIRMTIGLDAGDVLAVGKLAIGPDETAGELESRLGVLGAKLALEMVGRLAAGEVHGMVQDKSLATKAPKLTKEMGRIDWVPPAPAVWNHIRAMQPWPTAYTSLLRPETKPLRLIIVVAKPTEGPAAEVGTLRRDGDRVFVACGGDSWLELVEVQPEGKRRMSAADFLRGNPLPAGSRLGTES